jgi:hypothetical protein
MRGAAVSPTLELPGGEAANVNVELVESGFSTVPGELDLELHLVARDRQVTHRAGSANARPAPRTIRATVRKLAVLDGCTGLGAEELFVWHELFLAGHGEPAPASEGRTTPDAIGVDACRV